MKIQKGSIVRVEYYIDFERYNTCGRVVAITDNNCLIDIGNNVISKSGEVVLYHLILARKIGILNPGYLYYYVDIS